MGYNFSKAILLSGFILVALLQTFFSSIAGEQPKRKKVALVLSGGGAKGFAHIGVLKVLEEQDIPVDIIVGTSIGSLIGGVYSMGYNAAYIENLVKNQEWEKLLSDDVPRSLLSRNDKLLKQRYIFPLAINHRSMKSLPKGLINSQNVLNLFCGLAGNLPENADFLQFPVQFACVATDLETGDEVVMKNGFLPGAMYASMAIPGIFQPAEREGHILVDGGIANNFPVDVAKKMGADIIIGVDIRGNIFNREQLKSYNEVFGNLINFYSKGKDSINHHFCDLIIRPDVSGYSMGSFSASAADTLILRGEKAARSMINQLNQLKQTFQLPSKQEKKHLIMPEKWRITEIYFSGGEKLDIDFLNGKLNLEVPGDYSYQDIKKAIDRLYGTGGFSKIYFCLKDNPSGKTLILKLTPGSENSIYLGFSANTNDAACLMFNVTRKNYESWLRYLAAGTELSANPEFYLLAETKKKNAPAMGFEAKCKYLNYNIFENGHKFYAADLFYTSAILYFSQTLPKMSEIGVGFQQEYFDGDVFTKKADAAVSSTNTDFWLANAYLYLSFDNMDHFYFPTKGTRFYAEFSTCGELKKESPVNPSVLLKMNNIWPLSKKTAVLLDIYGRMILSSQYPVVKTTVVGGEAYSTYFNYHFPFLGLPPVILANKNVFITSPGLRYKIQENQYLTIQLNHMLQSTSLTSLNFKNSIWGGGIKYALKTVIGPVDVGLGYADLHQRLTLSANVGYWF